MSEQERKVGMDECRSVLSLDAWKTAQEVAVALGHEGSSADGAAVMARGCLHSLVQCKMAESRIREQTSKRGGMSPLEFRLTARGADKSAAPPPAAMRKAGRPSTAKSAKGAKKKRPYAKPAEQKKELAPPKTAQEITVTLCGDSVVLVRIPERISADTARAIAGVAEFYAERFAVRDDVPFLPLALK
jgi:hypothetical protein